jgi:predicted DNA-binding transcriptional regulator AlpA
MPKQKQPAKNEAAIADQPDIKRRWVRNGELAKYLGVGKMTLWRWQHNDASFPKSRVRNGIAFTDLDKIDEWMDQAEVA